MEGRIEREWRKFPHLPLFSDIFVISIIPCPGPYSRSHLESRSVKDDTHETPCTDGGDWDRKHPTQEHPSDSSPVDSGETARDDTDTHGASNDTIISARF